MMNRLFLIFILFAVAHFASAQKQSADPVLFTVADTPVHVSEFKYIYTKTNAEKADFSETSLKEYLDLYTKFKLKVEKARDMKIDTIPKLIKELEGYRRQLADSYLINKEVTEKLVKEAYDRKSQDSDFSHLLFSVDLNANAKDTMAAFSRAIAARKRILNGEDFAKVAAELSDDESAKNNGGRIGFLEVLFPDGFYPLENAVYTLPIGELSEPVRTKMGYHLVKVNSRRPARGEIEAAHILIREDGRTPEEAKEIIDSLYQLLNAGGDFNTIAKERSEDKRSQPNGGYLGFFGISKYEKSFEDAAFAIEEDNTISMPFKSSLGWHIVKRISHRGIQPYNIEKRRLEANIKNDGRFAKAQAAVLAQIKADGNFRENPEVLSKFTTALNDTFLTFRWQAPKQNLEKVLFTMDDGFQADVSDFVKFLRNASRKRMTYARSGDVNYVANRLYEEFVEQQCFKYEENRLEEKYPDFKALMREYEEGILLFEVTKMLVWDRASQDTAGLKTFFDSIKGKYRWGERAQVSIYKLKSEHEAKVKELQAFAKKNPISAVLAKFNSESEILTVEEVKMEKGRNMQLKRMEWKAGAISTPYNNEKDKLIEFMKIENMSPAVDKTLNEAKGYVIADYQDYLEKQWIEQLEKEYKIKVNNKVFEKLIKG